MGEAVLTVDASPGSGRRGLSKGSIATLVAVVALAVLAYVGVHLRHVHDVGWEYRWTPSAAPPRISFEGRHYLRGSAELALPAGEVPLGRTPGGGVIYGPAGPHRYAFLGVDVVWSGHITGYALSGGP